MKHTTLKSRPKQVKGLKTGKIEGFRQATSILINSNYPIKKLSQGHLSCDKH